MSNEAIYFNGKSLTADQLEDNATKMEENLKTVNKHTVIKMLRVLNSIINILKRKEDGIFSVLLKWFRLYLKLHNLIEPDNEMMLKLYENTVPTVITYLIGCLQYKPKTVANYHYNLLEILEELIESVQPSVLRKIVKFEKETIGCLWTPIELAGDYNTQLKALNIFSVLLKQLDENRQNEEFNAIKWTNLNFFQEKLKAVVQATKLPDVLENHSRELLNNYNMNLSKTLLVYSFYCAAVTFAKKYKFYKPVKLQKFWIDINYCPKTVSFCGRYKLNSSSKYEIIKIILKIRKITLKNNTLEVYFNKPGHFSKHFEHFTSEVLDVFEFTLPEEEKQRLINNNYVIEYFNNLNELDEEKGKAKTSSKNSDSKLLQNIRNSLTDLNTKANSSNLFDHLKYNSNDELPIDSLNITLNLSRKSINESSKTSNKNESIEQSAAAGLSSTSNLKRKSAAESSRTSIKSENELELRPKRSGRATNKFFKAFLMEESFDDIEKDVPKRKRKQKRKSRQTKPRCKQVCKVTPTVDLTKIEHFEPLPHNRSNANKRKMSFDDKISKTNISLFDTQRCNEVLQQVADIYEVGDTTYARPCQSYRNFQMQTNPIRKSTFTKDNVAIEGGEKQNHFRNQSSIKRKRKFDSQENKENENPDTNKTATILRPHSKTKTIISPQFFEIQVSDAISPLNKSLHNNITENVLSSSSEFEVVRGSNENISKDTTHICALEKRIVAGSSNATTPRPTSTMNISNLSDSDIDITNINNFRNRHQQTNLLQDDMELDMELIKLRNNSNAILKPLAANNEKSTAKANCEVFQQQIIDNFEDNSDDEFYSNSLAPIKKTISDLMANHLSNVGHNYENECMVFKNRQEETNSSDEEICNLNYQINCNETEPVNSKIENMVQKPSVLNHNLYQENDLYTSPDNNYQISSNLTTRTATKCRVTPTALIMQKIQVSAEKSIIIKRNPKTVSKANKCLNNFFLNQNRELMQYQRKNHDLHKQHLTCGRSSLEIHDMESDSYNFELRKNKQNNEIRKEISVQQQPSLTNFNLEENCGNISQHCGELGITHEGSAREGINDSSKNDLFRILTNYTTNINKRVDSILRQGITNISDSYTLHFLNITKAVFKKAVENRMKLEEIRSTMGNLVRELEWQYDDLINKSKGFDAHSEMCKQILENLTTAETPNFITKEYEDIFRKINTEQNITFKNMWHNILDIQEAK